MGATTFDNFHIVLVSVHCCLYLFISLSQPTFRPELSSYFRLVSEGGHICFWWFHTCTEDLELLGFFKSFLCTIVIHLWLADQQQVLWPESHGGQQPIGRLSVCFFFLLFFSSLSPSLETYLLSISDFDSYIRVIIIICLHILMFQVLPI